MNEILLRHGCPGAVTRHKQRGEPLCAACRDVEAARVRKRARRRRAVLAQQRGGVRRLRHKLDRLDHAAVWRCLTATSLAELPRLSGAELTQAVCALARRGATNFAIAEQLGVCERTVQRRLVSGGFRRPPPAARPRPRPTPPPEPTSSAVAAAARAAAWARAENARWVLPEQIRAAQQQARARQREQARAAQVALDEAVLALRRAGRSERAVATQLGIAKATVYRATRRALQRLAAVG